MWQWPVYCEHCEKWIPSGLHFEGPVNIDHIRFTGVGRICECGNAATIPDGVYRVANDAITAIYSSGLAPDELRKLSAILTKAAERLTPAGEIRAIIDQEFPDRPGLKAFLKENKEFMALLSLIATLLAWQLPKAPPAEATTGANRHERRKATRLSKVPRPKKTGNYPKKNVQLPKKKDK